MLPSRLTARNSWRTHVSVLQLIRSQGQTRVQHNNHGPHKEYFQDPSQYPPELRDQQQPQQQQQQQQQRHHGGEQPPARPLRHQIQSVVTAPAHSKSINSTHTFKHAHASSDPSSTATSTRPSFVRRAFRRALLASFFGAAGFATGWALVTWEYLQPPYERGTEEYEEMAEEIEALLDTAPICENLRDNGCIEEAAISLVSSKNLHGVDQHLVNQTLSGPQGFTYKIFRHKSFPVTAVVFFAGFGLEGSPDTLHPGTVSTMLHEAHKIHLSPIVQKERLQESYLLFTKAVSDDDASQERLYPGEIYTILVSTHDLGKGEVEDSDVNINSGLIAFRTTARFFRADDAPRFEWTEDGTNVHGTIVSGPTLLEGGFVQFFNLPSAENNETSEESRERLQNVLDSIASGLYPSGNP